MKSDTDKAPAEKLSRRKRLVFTGFLILLAVTPLIAVEIYLRVTQPYLDLWVITGRKAGSNPQSEWAFVDAFSAFRGRPGEYGGGKTVNSHGMISTPELLVSKPSDTLRIVFLGGSSTAGTGTDLADEDTWPWQVTENLRTEFQNRQIEFINGALSGYTSFESYGRLWSRLRFFSPDIIVIYHGWNEMYYFDDVDNITSWRTLADGDWTFNRPVAQFSAIEPLFIDYFIRPSQTLVFLRLLATGFDDGEVGVSKAIEADYDKAGLEIWRTNLRLFRETAQLMDAELFVAKQATLIVPDLPMEERESIRYEFHGFDHDAHIDAYQQIYKIIDEETPTDRVIDVTTISGTPEYFYDHVHPTKEGATEIAEIVSDALIAYLESEGHQP